MGHAYCPEEPAKPPFAWKAQLAPKSQIWRKVLESRMAAFGRVNPTCCEDFLPVDLSVEPSLFAQIIQANSALHFNWCWATRVCWVTLLDYPGLYSSFAEGKQRIGIGGIVHYWMVCCRAKDGKGRGCLGCRQHQISFTPSPAMLLQGQEGS